MAISSAGEKYFESVPYDETPVEKIRDGPLARSAAPEPKKSALKYIVYVKRNLPVNP
jgi:hypothetical protein